MSYREFKKIIEEKGWSIPFLRSDDAPPTDELMELLDRVGLNRYETLLTRYCREKGWK